MLSINNCSNLANHLKLNMEFENFENEKLTTREKTAIKIRSISNYIMGSVMIIAGFFFMFPIKYTARFVAMYDPVMIKLFAIVCWVYGAFRIYRGYNKNI